MLFALACQVVLLFYHQITTLVDLYPFNGARFYSGREHLAEAGINVVLMSLAPIGYAFQFRGLMLYGAVYYVVLLIVEIIIWWVPYFTLPTGKWRRAYNVALSLATSNFARGDALNRWLAVHERIHAHTLFVLPRRAGRIVPNLEHVLLHFWTLVTALATLRAYHIRM
jgi:hypothetical protein